jgi:hypothetical protein
MSQGGTPIWAARRNKLEDGAIAIMTGFVVFFKDFWG